MHKLNETQCTQQTVELCRNTLQIHKMKLNEQSSYVSSPRIYVDAMRMDG